MGHPHRLAALEIALFHTLFAGRSRFHCMYIRTYAKWMNKHVFTGISMNQHNHSTRTDLTVAQSDWRPSASILK